jgi:hypothetical protein
MKFDITRRRSILYGSSDLLQINDISNVTLNLMLIFSLEESCASHWVYRAGLPQLPAK